MPTHFVNQQGNFVELDAYVPKMSHKLHGPVTILKEIKSILSDLVELSQPIFEGFKAVFFHSR